VTILFHAHYCDHVFAIECTGMAKRRTVTFIVWSVMGHWRGEYTIDKFPNKECLVGYVCSVVCD